MKKKAIIFISDLHIMLNTLRNGEPKKLIKSWFNTNPKDENVNRYLDSFIEIITSTYKKEEYEFYLLISGDITDEAQDEEFEKSIQIVEKIKSELSISNEKLLIVPGDHDVNWRDCENAFDSDNKSKHSYLYNEKYNRFSKFYKSIFGYPFDTRKIIIGELITDKIVFIGMNSNYKIDFTGGNGYILKEQLKEELIELNEKYKNHSKIALFHHNISPFYENNVNGQWEPENRIEILKLLKEFQFKGVMFGNEHTTGSVEEDLFNCIGVGSLGMKFLTEKDAPPSFKVYTIYEDNSVYGLNQNLFHLIGGNKNNSNTYGNWGIQNNKQLNEIDEIKLIKKPPQAIEVSTILAETTITSEITLIKEISKEEILSPYDYQENPYHDKIFNRVRELKIFHSGHFHWSDNSKAHNWIEVAKLLNDKEDVLLCKKAILNTVTENKIEFDFIIGLGIEGNILATRTAMVSNKPYSFLPYSYRYEDHADYEQKLSIENTSFEKILIITDVVHDGNTIRKLINEKENKFFEKVKEIIVISLFYSGKDEYNFELINMTQSKKDIEKEKGNLKYEHQPIEDRIKFYFVSKMVVETCPYGADFRETCMIVKHKLDCVHEFYDAK